MRNSFCFRVWARCCSVLFLSALMAPASYAGESPAAMYRFTPGHSGALAGPALELSGYAWRVATGGPVRSAPAVQRGVAVFGSCDGFLYAVDAKTGAERWKAKLGGEVTSSPAIADGDVIILGGDGTVRALRLDDGSERWAVATGADVPFGPDPRMFDVWSSSPTVAGGMVYVGSGDGKVYAIERASGRVQWTFATQHRVRSTPAVADGSLYVGSFDGHVYALDAATGAEKWKFQTGDGVQASPAVMGGTVFVGSRSMSLYALDAATGALKWRRPHPGSWILASAAVAAGKVIIGGSDSHLLEALDADTGQPVWSRMVNARVLGSPVVVGDVVVYSAEDFRIYTADLESGLGLSMEGAEGAFYGSPVPAGDLVLVGSEDRHLYAFHTRARRAAATSAPLELLQAAAGTFRSESGDEFTLVLQDGRLAFVWGTFPPAALNVTEDGRFECPMLWGTAGRFQREPGQPVTALQVTQFGREFVARRVN